MNDASSRYANSIAAGRAAATPKDKGTTPDGGRYANTRAAIADATAMGSDRYANTRAVIVASTPSLTEQADPARQRYAASLAAVGAPAATPAAAGAPLELEAPAGFDANDAMLGEFRKVAGEFGLTPDRGKRLLELHARAVEAERAARDAEVERWRAQTDADPELVAGADAAREVVRKFGTPELLGVLNDTAVGDHPEMVRFVVRVARALRGAR